MPTDLEAVVSLSLSMAEIATKFANSHAPSKHLQDQIAIAAEKLAIAAREPDENMYYLASQIPQNAAIRSVISMGVLDVMPLDGGAVTPEEVGSRLNIPSDLVGRMLRACAAAHFFISASANHYAHSALSRNFLSLDNRAMFTQMYDFLGPGVLAIPAFCASGGWTTAGAYDNGPFQLAEHTDLGYWEFLASKPDRLKAFNSGMRLGKFQTLTRSAFPFGDALDHDPCEDGGVAIVDVGGGRGQRLEMIRADWPLLKGRMVLQDLPDVITDAKERGLPPFIETSVGSFFEEQPVKGARVYHFRRIFHCWTAEKCELILRNTKDALDDLSRLVIADMVLPDVDCPRDLAMKDLNMMSLGGMERSASQWRGLIESAGLAMRKIWINEDGPEHAIIEAVLPTFKGHHLD
ncbi:S-adenosyl-L-methionine-dependent methyltransferase [Nemania sp. NC0429]|nr:S-adenosyl-L-methionine-dependent methyltransferase [Nemania sp. NC0429]